MSKLSWAAQICNKCKYKERCLPNIFETNACARVKKIEKLELKMKESELFD